MAKATQRESSRALERLDILARVGLGLGTLVLSAVIGWATLRYNERAAQRQIQSQIDALELQKRATAAKILVDQLSTIVGGPEEERDLTLKLLEVVDPELVRQVGERLLARAESEEDAERAEAIIESSVAAAQAQVVPGRVENARKFLDLRVYPAAAREYLKAYESLSPERRQRISGQVEEATRLYDKGEFSEAARALARAFEDLDR